MIYRLIAFDKFQNSIDPGFHGKEGEIIFEQDNVSGFLEHIIKEGFKKYVWQIQWGPESKNFSYSFDIGTFEDKKILDENNSILASKFKEFKNLIIE